MARRNQSHRSLIMDMKILIYFVAFALCCILPVIADPAALNCTITSHPDGSTTYSISKPPPSADCETSWMARNRTVLAVDTQSLNLSECLDKMIYILDCPGLKINQQAVVCTKNCTELPAAHILIKRGDANPVSISTLICMGFCVTPMWFGIGFSILVAVIIGLVLVAKQFWKDVLRFFGRHRDTARGMPPEEVCLKS